MRSAKSVWNHGSEAADMAERPSETGRGTPVLYLSAAGREMRNARDTSRGRLSACGGVALFGGRRLRGVRNGAAAHADEQVPLAGTAVEGVLGAVAGLVGVVEEHAHRAPL